MSRICGLCRQLIGKGLSRCCKTDVIAVGLDVRGNLQYECLSCRRGLYEKDIMAKKVEKEVVK